MLARFVRNSVAASVVVAVSSVLSPASSTVVTLVATDSGFVTETGGTDKFDGTVAFDATGNYSVGYEVACPAGGLCPGGFVPMQRKNYFMFDLGAISSPVLGATLTLLNPLGGYESPDDPPTPPNESEVYVVGATDPALVPGVIAKIADIGSVVTPADVTPLLVSEAAVLFSELADSLGPAGVPALGAPVPADFPIGEATLTKTTEGTVVDVVLNPFGVDYVNEMVLLGFDLVLGGAVSTAAPADGPTPQSLFGFTGVSSIDLVPPSLELTLAAVPEPGLLLLFGTGLGFLGAFRTHPCWRRV